MYMNDFRLNVIFVTFIVILGWAVLFAPNSYVSGAVIVTDFFGALIGIGYLLDNKDKK